jgi:hypothetical protein
MLERMGTLRVASTIASVGAAFIAAVFWFWASATRIPPFPDVGLDSSSDVFDPVRNALRKANQLNAVAAFFSGVAALVAAIVLIAS